MLGQPSKPRYSLIQERLYYRNKLVLPTSSTLIPLIMYECHDSPSRGHFRVLKTLKRISVIGMKHTIQSYVAACPVCQRNKYSTLSPNSLLQPLPIPHHIWEDLSLDFIEGLPKSKGWDTILVVVDRLSMPIWLKHPFTVVSVAVVFVCEIVRLHGIPRPIVSDRDKLFLSKFYGEPFRLQGTTLRFNTTYHPQSDGQTEVLNRCLETYLGCFVHHKLKSWGYYLPWAEYWYNTSFHTTANTTPFRIVYGRDPPSLLAYEAGCFNFFGGG